MLFRTRFGDVWPNQCIGQVDVFLKVFKTRLFDLDMQTQSSEIQDMDRLRTYKILKTTFGCEQYVFAVKNKLYSTAMSKLRGGLLKIGCNEGRYSS